MLDNENQYLTTKPNYTVIIVLGLLLLYLLIKDELAQSAQINNENKIIEDPNYNLASQLRSAFNISIISDWITTYDEDMIFDVAGKITDWQGVQQAYYKLYSETLISRLGKVFKDSPQKLNLFYSKVSGTKNTNPLIPKGGNLKLGAQTTSINPTTAFDLEDSRIVLRTYSAGKEVGKYLGDFNKQIKGITYAVIEIPWYVVFTKKALVVKNDLITY